MVACLGESITFFYPDRMTRDDPQPFLTPAHIRVLCFMDAFHFYERFENPHSRVSNRQWKQISIGVIDFWKMCIKNLYIFSRLLDRIFWRLWIIFGSYFWIIRSFLKKRTVRFVYVCIVGVANKLFKLQFWVFFNKWSLESTECHNMLIATCMN